MAENEVTLQRCGIGGRDLDGCQLAETGIDAIDRRIAGGGAGNEGCGRLDPGTGGGVKFNRAGAGPDRMQIGQRGGTGDQTNLHVRPPKIRMCSGLKPMR